MKKSKKKEIEIVKSDFYKLDSSKRVVVEGYRSVLPWILLFMAIFFCAILAFIISVNKESGTYDDEDYKVFYILCGVLLGVAVILFVAYHVRNALVRKRVLACDVTYATVTAVIVEEYTTRDNDGDSHTKERVSLTYSFYDKLGNVRTERYHKTYGKAPAFFEGQQIVVAFDDSKSFVLSKYTLIGDDFREIPNGLPQNADASDLTGETVKIKVDKYVPLGYDKRYYIMAAVYLAFALFFAAMLTYFALTVKDVIVWAYVGFTGLFLVIFLILAVQAAIVPFSAKRKYDEICAIGATYTLGKLEYTSKVYGNGSKGNYVCKYVDVDGNERQFRVNANLSKKLVRYGDTEVYVAYANDKAVALVEKIPLSKLLR